MENGISNSDYVILICTQEYQRRLLGQVEAGIGRGVKWESNIIYQKLYMSDSLNTKFIPVVFNRSDIKYIPTPIQGNTYYDVSNTDGFNTLYWRLRGITTKQKPPLGKLRPVEEKERKTLYVTTMIDIDTWNKATWRGAGFLIGYNDLPTLLLPFINEEHAKRIFSDWIKLVGKDDRDDDIRIALIEGDVPDEKKGYYIVISSNLDGVVKRAEERGFSLHDLMIMNFSRIIRANPTDNFKVFNLFKEAYLKYKEYYLIPAIIDEKNQRIKPLSDLSIHKRKLLYRNIKDIDENDEDAMVLAKDKPWRNINLSLIIFISPSHTLFPTASSLSLSLFLRRQAQSPAFRKKHGPARFLQAPTALPTYSRVS